MKNDVPALDANPKKTNRFTVHSLFHHEKTGEKPFSMEGGFSAEVQTDEESFSRKFRATEEFQPLNFGWLAPQQAGLVVIRNVEGEGLLLIPSEDEKAQIAKRVIEVAIEGAEPCVFPIAPKQFHPFYCTDPSKLRIRCQCGSAEYRIFVVPR